MRFEIKELQMKYGFSIIYVTHDQSEAMALSDYILVMKNGVMQQIDTPLNIYNHPINKFVFSFIGLSNFLKAGWQDGRPVLEGMVLDASFRPPEELRDVPAIALASRPSEIDFASTEETGVLRGVVTRKSYLGEIIDYQIQIGEQFLRVQKGRRAPGPDEGENCAVSLLRPFWYSDQD